MNKNKTKILHVAQSNGGVEEYLKMFMKYSDNDNYQNVLLVSQQYVRTKQVFNDLGVKVYIVEMQREINFVSDVKAMINIYKIIKKENPDIVYSHSSKAGALSRIPAKILKVTNIYNPHGWAFDMNINKIKKLIYKTIEKILAIITNKIIAISEYEKDVSIKNNIAPIEKIRLIKNAVDIDRIENTQRYDEIIDDLGWNKEDIIIGMVARITEQKSPETFVEIARKLIVKHNNVKFMLIGDGEKRKEIEQLIKLYDLDNKFYISGWVDNPIKYIKLFDFALLTSKWEGFGLVIPEYMAAKKVVIASNVGGITDIIDDKETGFLVDTVDDYVRIISKLINDKNEMNRIAENAQRTAKGEYDFRRVIKQHNELFENEVI